jgi:hypothetical protein
MDHQTRNYLRQRSAHSGRVEIKRDTLIAALGGLLGYLAPQRFTQMHPLAFAVVTAIGAVVSFEVVAYVWRFVWSAPKRMHQDDQRVIVRLEEERNEAWQRRDEALVNADKRRAMEQERDELKASVQGLAARGVRRDKPAWSRECKSHTGKG